uniref:NUDIX hydrolase n=1 Tax=Ornithobacterium rhinotracheale TaxID=28251 RepID=UPI0039A58386
MDYQLNSYNIKKLFKQQCAPGWSAQKVMAPPYRQSLVDKAKYNPANPKLAAVLIIIYEEKGELYFPVIHRNTYPGVHSNQIGFPGGRVESADENLQATALRESLEEINANPNCIEIVGELSQLFIPPSNFMVHPFVGVYNGKPDFIPSEREVKAIIPLKLNEFIHSPNIIEHTVVVDNIAHQVPAFALPNNLICWGATAMMLNEFLVFLRNSLNL